MQVDDELNESDLGRNEQDAQDWQRFCLVMTWWWQSTIT
jgi:hypothetical protein